MKIAVIIPRFSLSGVPLAQLRLAHALARRSHEVIFIVGYIDPDYHLPSQENVRLEVWARPKVRAMLMPLIHFLQSENPDIVFSAEDHLNSVVLLAALLSRSRAKISVSSRVTPFDTYSNIPLTKRWILKWLVRLLIRRADAVTCVSKDMVVQYKKLFRYSPHVCVYNIVADEYSREKMREAVDHQWLCNKASPVLIAAGRLASWKDFRTLIDAVALLSRRRSVKLLILGDGPQRDELQRLIEEKCLSDCVSLLGYVKNPLKYFSRSDVFVLSSLVEGLPNVLVEAMMCGCTPVATNCPTGPREVLKDGAYGYLIPVRDPVAMADAIECALTSPISQDLLAQAVAPFQDERVIKEHFRLLGLDS